MRPLLALALLLMSACQPDAAPPAGTQPATQATVARPLPAVQAALLVALQAPAGSVGAPSHPSYGPQFATYGLVTNEQQLLDYRFRRYDQFNSADTVPLNLRFVPAATVTPALQAYIALPVAARAPDLLLERAGDNYWPTPDYPDAQGHPLPYTCDYLVHLAAPTAAQTQLEVIALNSRVLDGTEWHLDVGRDGLSFPWPRRRPRRRDVPPSPADRQQVLATLVRLAR